MPSSADLRFLVIRTSVTNAAVEGLIAINVTGGTSPVPSRAQESAIAGGHRLQINRSAYKSKDFEKSVAELRDGEMQYEM